jgi:hypothetical protein
MLEFNDRQIFNDAESVGDVADAIGDFRSRAGRNSYRRGIESGAEEELHKTVRPAVLRAARRHVGEHASEIDFIDVGWNGRQYSIGVGTDSAIVKSHEFGSGRFNTRAGRTGGSPNGYRINPDGNNEALAFDVGGQTVVVEHVVHPGVKPKGFMTEALRESADDVADTVADEIVEQFREALR